MAKFHGIFCHPFLPSILIIEGMGGMGNRVGWGGKGWSGVGWEVAKPPYLGHPVSSHDAHTMASDTPVGHIVRGSKFRSPLPNWHPPLVPLF